MGVPRGAGARAFHLLNEREVAFIRSGAALLAPSGPSNGFDRIMGPGRPIVVHVMPGLDHVRRGFERSDHGSIDPGRPLSVTFGDKPARCRGCGNVLQEGQRVIPFVFWPRFSYDDDTSSVYSVDAWLHEESCPT